jgi:EAL domain-containing protein (putative c-di-GMP-specific phosphodiesterase class I)
VEKPEQETALREIGGKDLIVQGYLYGKPLPLPAFEEALSKESGSR